MYDVIDPSKRTAAVLVLIGLVAVAVVGTVAAAVTIDLGIPDAVEVVLYGREAEDFFGTDLAAGDIDGDGLDDVAVGAYLADGPGNSRNGAGEVHLFYGRPPVDWPAGDLLPDVVVYGAREGDLLGGDMAKDPGHIAMGDIDGDGMSDLVVSAPRFDNGEWSRGRVWIIWGREERLPIEIDLLHISPGLQATSIAAPADSYRTFLGSALATGDFDSDGVEDLAMSAPLASHEGCFKCGRVYVLYGASDLRQRTIWLDDVPSDLSVFTAVGPDRGSKLGSYLAFGQLSDDSVPDLVIGSEMAGDNDMGTVHVLFGASELRNTTWDFADDPPDWSAMGEASLDQLGRALATGDVNADGQDDLIIGAPTADGPAGANAGQVIAVFGPLEQGVLQDFGVSPGDFIMYGPQGGMDPAWLGGSVGVGDYNGDDTGDLLAGARQANALGRDEAGIVYLTYGDQSLNGTRDMQSQSTDITLIGAGARDFTGYVTVGDVTGDGIDDVIASATDASGFNGEPLAGRVYILFGSRAEPTPIPTFTPTATPTVTPTPSPTDTPTITPTPTATKMPRNAIHLPLILHNYVGNP